MEVKLEIFAKQAYNWSAEMLLGKQVLRFWPLNLISCLDAKACSKFSLADIKKR